MIFFQLTDEVVRKKSEYQKHLEGYKALRTRFEEFYIKGVYANQSCSYDLVLIIPIYSTRSKWSETG